MMFYLKKLKMTWTELWNLFQVVWQAGKDPISKHPEYFQNLKLLSKLYQQQPSAKVYLDHNALEWQFIEGYCGPATLRCTLASLGVPSELLPPQVRGPMGPEMFVQRLQAALTASSTTPAHEDKKPNDETNNNTNATLSSAHHFHFPKIETEIVRGDCSYDIFLQTIRRVKNDKERVVLNFLRPALFGPQRPMWIPTHLLMGLFGGHFSPIIGVLENYGEDDDDQESDNPLVAVFDVNHKYGGAYFVPARRLYQSVQARDVMTGQSRALVLVTNKSD
jgi:hypothetical protein